MSNSALKTNDIQRRRSLGLTRNIKTVNLNVTDSSTGGRFQPESREESRGTDCDRQKVSEGECVAKENLKDTTLDTRAVAKGIIEADVQRRDTKSSGTKRFYSPLPSKSLRSRKRFKSDFKSPVRSSEDFTSQLKSCDSILDELKKTRAKLAAVDKEIHNLESSGCNTAAVDQHLDRIHQYNELKDLGQHLIGQIAMKNGTTTSHEYPRFGLDLND